MSASRAGPDARKWARRIAWLFAIWMLSVAALGLVAWMLRGIMRLAGLSS